MATEAQLFKITYISVFPSDNGHFHCNYQKWLPDQSKTAMIVQIDSQTTEVSPKQVNVTRVIEYI